AVVDAERTIAGLVERLADANRLHPDLRVRTLHQVTDEAGIRGPEAFERPQRVDARELIRRRARELRQRRYHRLVLAQDEQLLRHVAPPAIRIAEVRHELR